MTCDRCHKETGSIICSMFNTQGLCHDCKAAERNHPKYREAADAEMAAVRNGNYNFPGVGLPPDLR
jgi:hypothetical protein